MERYGNLDLDLECDGGAVSEDLSSTVKISGSNDNLPVNSNTKEAGGMFSSMFKKSPNPQEDFAAPDELSGSNDKNHAKDDLSVDDELLAGNDSAGEKSSKGGVAKVLRSPFTSSSQDKEKTGHSGDSQENSSATEKPKTKENEKEAGSIEEDSTVSNKKSSGQKENAVVGAMSKLISFRQKKDTEDAKTLKENEKQVGEKFNASPEVKGTSSHDKVKPRRSEDNNEGKDMTSTEKKEKPATPPAVPARPSEEAASDDVGVNADEESASKEEKNEEEVKEKMETKVKIKKKHNPFMPDVKL